MTALVVGLGAALRGWMWPCLLLLSAAPAAVGARTLAILPFSADGAPQHVADAAEDAFVDAALRTPGVTLVPQATVHTLTSSLLSAGWKADASPGSLLTLTPLTRAHQFVRAQVFLEAGDLRVRMDLLDANSGAVERNAQRLLPVDADLALSMRGAAAELLRPSAYRGAVRVSCPSPGVTLLLGTESLGECRDVLDVNDLAPGTHAVRARKDGHAEVLQRVEVLFDRITRVEAAEAADGLHLDVLPQEHAVSAAAPPVPAPESPVSKPPAASPAPSTHRLDPRVVAGLGVAAAGAPITVVGIGLAVAAVMITGAWPRYDDDGTIRPLSSVENGALLSLRVYGTLALIPLGLAVALAGLATLATGVGLAVYGFTQGE